MAKTSLQLLLVVALITCWPSADAELRNDIRLCKNKNLGGDCIVHSLKAEECTTVDKNDWASSASLHENCFRLFEEDKCQGRSRAIFADTPGLNDFATLGMDKKVSSVSACSKNDHCPATRSKRSSNNHNCHFFNDVVTIGFVAWLPRDTSNLGTSPVRYYQIGPFGRTEVMEADIEIRHLNTGTVTKNSSVVYARGLGRSTDQAGHILAKRLGGSGTDERNLFPQFPHFNMGAWSHSVEAWVAQLVNDHGRVRYTVNLIYETNSDTRPTQLVYRIEWKENQKTHIFVGDLGNP